MSTRRKQPKKALAKDEKKAAKFIKKAATIEKKAMPMVNRKVRRGGKTEAVGRTQTVALQKRKILRGKPNPTIKKQGDNTTMIVHDEYLGQVAGSNGFTLQEFRVNPALPSSFPKISATARTFEDYQCNSLELIYVTEMGSQNNGSVMWAHQPDPDEPAPTSRNVLLQMACSESFAVWTQQIKKTIPKVNLTKAKNLYTRLTDSVPTGGSYKLYDAGKIFIATQGTLDQNGNVIPNCGDLYFRAKFTLRTPLDSDVQEYGAEFTGNMAGTVVDHQFGILGTNPKITNNTFFYEIIPFSENGSGVISVPPDPTVGTSGYFFKTAGDAVWMFETFTKGTGVTSINVLVNGVTMTTGGASNFGVINSAATVGYNAFIYALSGFSSGGIPRAGATVSYPTIYNGYNAVQFYGNDTTITQFGFRITPTKSLWGIDLTPSSMDENVMVMEFLKLLSREQQNQLQPMIKAALELEDAKRREGKRIDEILKQVTVSDEADQLMRQAGFIPIYKDMDGNIINIDAEKAKLRLMKPSPKLSKLDGKYQDNLDENPSTIPVIEDPITEWAYPPLERVNSPKTVKLKEKISESIGYDGTSWYDDVTQEETVEILSTSDPVQPEKPKRPSSLPVPKKIPQDIPVMVYIGFCADEKKDHGPYVQPDHLKKCQYCFGKAQKLLAKPDERAKENPGLLDVLSGILKTVETVGGLFV